MPIDIITLPMDKFVYGNAKEHVEFMLNIHKEVRKQIERASEEYKKQGNKNVHGTRKVEVEDLVWVHLSKERFSNQKKDFRAKENTSLCLNLKVFLKFWRG